MKKVLYMSNIEVPYRVRFFNELARNCDLTVLYEREISANRNAQWAKSEAQAYRVKYLNGVKIGNESTFSLKILRELRVGYDRIIVGCYNTPSQMLAILYMRLLRIPYILNVDGEPFLKGSGWKQRIKRFFISGADKYVIAGEKAAESLRTAIGDKEIIPYYFSSLSEQELTEHKYFAENAERNDCILVVGQYFDYKGMDIALAAAAMDPSLRYKFVGMGARTKQFLDDHTIPSNVEIIPFLQKQELEKEYQSCAMLVLPSRQECWGLVINEAASFGTPIVSTWGSGAAVEFLSEKYPRYLAAPGNAENLYKCILLLRVTKDLPGYMQYLVEKSQKYTIENGAKRHLSVL